MRCRSTCIRGCGSCVRGTAAAFRPSIYAGSPERGQPLKLEYVCLPVKCAGEFCQPFARSTQLEAAPHALELEPRGRCQASCTMLIADRLMVNWPSAGLGTRRCGVWDAARGGSRAVIQGTGDREADIEAIAAGPSCFPFRALSRGLETVIDDAVTLRSKTAERRKLKAQSRTEKRVRRPRSKVSNTGGRTPPVSRPHVSR
jgi:hypothetical protein